MFSHLKSTLLFECIYLNFHKHSMLHERMSILATVVSETQILVVVALQALKFLILTFDLRTEHVEEVAVYSVVLKYTN